MRTRFDALRGRVEAWRERIEAKPTLRRTYRVVISAIGGIVLVAGIIMIPYPGPGWAVVFIGLAVLATEFAWARRLLRYARSKYDAWTDWLARQTFAVRLLVLAATGLVVLATLYLLNVYYLVADVVGLDAWTWLQSPLFG
ncbi:TIGR02611 family protein [Pseudonocardia sp. CNS-139]|nr:TIGR02611 family protein [Pseudonocardia sp. CNS-139]